MTEHVRWWDVIRTTISGGLFGGVLCGAVFGSASELHGLVTGAAIAAVFMIEARFKNPA